MTARTRWLVALSLVFGLGYPLLWGLALPAAAMIAVKGAGVALLALAAASGARTLDGWLLAGLMALGATGDVLLEVDFAAGAAAFAAGHVPAILLYLRNRRAAGTLDWAVAALLPLCAGAIPALLLHPRPEAWPFAGYALLLGAMAATAWLSRFPRLVPLGAFLFLASDMLIAVRMAGGETWLGLPIWLLYYVGQLMIFLGVTSSLPAEPVGRI
jgi:uncharacterized membrane protein YhhN